MSAVKKVFVGILVVLIVIVLVAVLVAGYFGLIPGLADVFGANKPRDLGVRYTQADYTNYLAKTHTQVFDFAQAPVAPARPNDTIIYADPQFKNVSLSNAEITSRVGFSKWKDLPVSDVQIKCGAGGVIEISGRLVSDRLLNFVGIAGNGGYNDADVKTGLDWLNVTGKNPAIYLKANASVTNNVVNVTVDSAQINRFGLPNDLVAATVASLTQTIFTRVTGFDAKSVTFSENALNFIGTSPAKVYVKQ